MTTFILVHGAFQGGWVWDRVAPLLRFRGYAVYCPTLTGLGERSNELTPQVGLEDHIRDVCKVIDAHHLSHIVLVGHSYGGIVISGVAKERSSQIDQLLYLDAPIPENNESLLGALGQENIKLFFDSLVDGWKVNPFPVECFGLTKASDLKWALPQHTPQSLKTFTDPVSVLEQRDALHLKMGYIHCTPGNDFTLTQFHRAKEKGWDTFQLQAPHCPMITHPEELAELLCAIRRG